MGTTEHAIAAERLVKRYGRTVALDGLDLEVTSGEVHGFLGPNGAGKTTTIRILLGLLRHNAGAVRVLGRDPWHDAVALHRQMAYVPGDVELWPSLTGGEAIDVLGRLRGDLDRGRVEQLCHRFDLDPTKRCRTYSKGNRQKVALVAALASDADLLLLDEPTAGLDPLMEAVFQECIHEIKAQGRTVLLSSHILAQVEKLADRVSIIRRGRVVERGTLDELRHLTRTTIVARMPAPPAELAHMAGVHGYTQDGDRVQLDVDAEHLNTVLAALADHGVTSLISHPPTLEQLLLRHYGDELNDSGVSA
ncbi:MAG: ABC transporter ATP-binding protein [Nitriliruptoraceae bacterium]